MNAPLCSRPNILRCWQVNKKPRRRAHEHIRRLQDEKNVNYIDSFTLICHAPRLQPRCRPQDDDNTIFAHSHFYRLLPPLKASGLHGAAGYAARHHQALLLEHAHFAPGAPTFGDYRRYRRYRDGVIRQDAIYAEHDTLAARWRLKARLSRASLRFQAMRLASAPRPRDKRRAACASSAAHRVPRDDDTDKRRGRWPPRKPLLY